MGLLQGKVAIVSGVGEGLGGDAARLFAGEGAKVVLMARSAAIVERIQREIENAGGESIVALGDITKVADCAAVAAKALNAFGQIDVLCNVAAKGDRPYRLPLLELDEEFTPWRESFEINVIGTMKMTRAVIPHMIERKQGRIIMVNSMTGELVRQHSYAYSASKSALHKIAQVLALELAPHNIRVNSLHPGYMWGPVVQATMERESALTGLTQDEWRKNVAREIPLGYIPPTSEYAGALLFMACDLSAPMTGASLHVNGGQFLR